MTETERVEIEGRALLLYDGVCALCNGVVGFLLKRDKLSKLRYTPLQSALGREILARFGIEKTPDGVALLTDALTPQERFFQRSDAVQAALQLLGTPWRALFGRHDTCPIPPPGQRGKIVGVYE
jgi:predicted DCC family thiol-disulfide oxidoreductase YuxK